ncbi:hypothetical protein X777_00660, partial [Ooceraea biroi]
DERAGTEAHVKAALCDVARTSSDAYSAGKRRRDTDDADASVAAHLRALAWCNARAMAYANPDSPSVDGQPTGTPEPLYPQQLSFFRGTPETSLSGTFSGDDDDDDQVDDCHLTILLASIQHRSEHAESLDAESGKNERNGKRLRDNGENYQRNGRRRFFLSAMNGNRSRNGSSMFLCYASRHSRLY